MILPLSPNCFWHLVRFQTSSRINRDTKNIKQNSSSTRISKRMFNIVENVMVWFHELYFFTCALPAILHFLPFISLGKERVSLFDGTQTQTTCDSKADGKLVWYKLRAIFHWYGIPFLFLYRKKEMIMRFHVSYGRSFYFSSRLPTYLQEKSNRTEMTPLEFSIYKYVGNYARRIWNYMHVKQEHAL